MPIDQGACLLTIARAEISTALGRQITAEADAPWLHHPGATFVTLTQAGELRGCIGSLEAHRPLLLDVKANALAAAFQDPRFMPLTLHELELTRVEISLLSTSEALTFNDQQDALSQLRPHIDGIIFEYRHYRSTFLPQVWEQLPDAETFMAHLKRKAGLTADFWAENVRLSRYTVTKWKEPEPAREVKQA
ncbi:MAG: AmmeMemoRadiSam system protein A [Pseudomonadota bacterium]